MTAMTGLLSSPPSPSSLSPWRTPPAAKSQAPPISSSPGSTLGRGGPPRVTTQAAAYRSAELSPRLRRLRGCSRSQRSYGATMSAVELQPSLALKAEAVELSHSLKGTSLFLVGMNNAMKTSLGKALAEALRYYYFDSDSLVEEAAGGQSAARTFREADESGFRDSETEVLKQLSSMGRLVVCAGDGAVQSVTNLSYLRYGISVWVDIPLDIVADEVSKKGVELPNAQGISMPDPFAEVLTGLAKQYKEMKGGYSTADATVSLLKVASKLGYDDLNTVTPEDMALEVLIEIEKLTRVKKMMEDAARPF
uniref:Shikimate kinase, chloroplastic n=1 Tax=Anthurium amnicola TaxID=1678845 RepID=A0A1D1ZH40_9ARAE